jgi:predicted outer membrane repeat protein
MASTTWLQELKGILGFGTRIQRPRSHGRKVSARRSFVPRLEAFEERTLLSTFAVVNLNDSGTGSLRAAVAAANAQAGADTIIVANGLHGTITLTSGELLITDSVTINGSGANRLTISGNNAGSVFDISPGPDVTSGLDVTIKNLTISNGFDFFGGGIVSFDSTLSLTVSSCALNSNQAQGEGGAIFNSGTLTVDNCTFNSNQGGFDGGAIFDPGTLTVDNSSFNNNQAEFGGGAILSEFGTLTIANSSLDSNQATESFSQGGAIESAFGLATISNSVVSGNAAGSGGGIVNYLGSMNVQGCTVSNNSTSGGDSGGGGILSSGGGSILTVDHSTISDNTTNFTGGGIALIDGGSLTLSNSLISGNTSARDGGGITLQSISANVEGTVSNSTITGNTAQQFSGGGILNIAFGAGTSATLTVQGCTINGNTAPAGGGVSNEINQGTSTATIANTSLFHNKAVGNGPGGSALGGALNNVGSMSVTNSILTGNLALGTAGGDGVFTAGYGEGGGINSSGPLTVTDSVFLNNQAIGAPLVAGAQPSEFSDSPGGAICAFGSSAIISNSTFIGNQVTGASGQPGSPGSEGDGGAIAVFSEVLTVSNSTFLLNSAVGGAGGAASPGGAGVGGAIDLVESSATISKSTFSLNVALGGVGGVGASGGAGIGGAIDVGGGVQFGAPESSSLTLGGSTILGNQALGGDGGTGITSGGAGLGGGLFIAAGASASLTGSSVMGNQADGGSGSGGGTDGQGVGGGVYDLGALTFDLATIIALNHASTSNNNVFP